MNNNLLTNFPNLFTSCSKARNYSQMKNFFIIRAMINDTRNRNETYMHVHRAIPNTTLL